MSKTALTIESYLNRGNQLWVRASNMNNISSSELSPIVFIQWLENLLPSLKPSSRRQYIASVREFLLTSLCRCINAFEVIELERAIQLSQKMQSSDFRIPIEQPKHWRNNTSGQKSKYLKLEDLRILVKQSECLIGKWIKPALLWLTASLIVGLRPSEWRYAELNIISEETVLKVVNAKNTNGRSNSNVRNINVTNLKPNELNLIRLQLAEARLNAVNDQIWNAYYAGARNALYRITRKLLSSRKTYPTLYTGRHQFAADSKSSGLSKVEIACLMGHATDETAGSHYGKRKHGRGNCRVKAKNSEMATVREMPVKKSSLIKQNKKL